MEKRKIFMRVLLIGTIILNFIVASNISVYKGSLTLGNIANAWPWSEYDPPPPAQIGEEVGCEIWVYGCFLCGGGNGWCITNGTMRSCIDQYVCPSCTCTPGPCIPTSSC